MSKSSKKRKKEKAIKDLNRKLIEEKNYRTLQTSKKLLRCLKETGHFKAFISLVMKKHHTGMQGSINLIKSNPDIFYLIGYYEKCNWNMFGSQSWWSNNFDELTIAYMELFKKFRPIN